MSCTPGQLVSLCAYYLFSFHPLLPFPVSSEFISVFVIHLLPASLFLLRGLGTAGPRCVCHSPFFSVRLNLVVATLAFVFGAEYCCAGLSRLQRGCNLVWLCI